MPATATPRKPQTLARKLVETRNTSRNRGLAAMLGLGESEKELARDFGSGLNDVIGRGTLASLIGLPGDLGGLAENGIRSALGMPQVQPYGGSEHIGQKLEEAGLVSPVRRPKTELLASLISPAQAATAGYKAPQMARAGVRMLDNLAAPRTMGSQTGAIENLWHGSPHTFDRFDLSKIGTGEGAQAYGHGAYLAEHPVTAETYAQKLSGAPAGPPMPVDFLHGGKAYKKNGQQLLEQSESGEWREIGKDEYLSAYQDAQATYEQMPKGNLYQTRLAWPDPAREATDPLSPDHFLHWDKPLSEQPYAMERLRGSDYLNEQLKAGGFYPSDIDSGLFEGRHLVSAKRTGVADESEAMRQLGIPGIRYLDGGSRGAGAGSHNYVVFDDRLIDIVGRNGQPVGNLGKMVAPQDEALRVAQQNAAKPIEQGGLGLRPDNTPEERAAAMGFDYQGYHGTTADFGEFDQGRSKTTGAFFSADPEYANIVAELDGARNGGARVVPAYIRMENPRYVASEAFQRSDTREAKAEGHDGLITLSSGNPSQLTSFDSRNIRSRFAAFDPMRRDSSDILAGLAPLGLGAWMYQDEPVK